MSYPSNQPITYTAVAATPGYPSDTFAYAWVFDDLGTGTGATLAHTWTTVGNHAATVTAVDQQLNTSATATKTITIAGFTWSLLGAMAPYIRGPIAANISANLILSAGGIDTVGTKHALCYTYDGTTWTTVGSMVNARTTMVQDQVCEGVLLPNGKVLVAGNVGSDPGQRSTELYNPISTLWEVGGNMLHDRGYWCRPILLDDGRVMVAGGADATTTSTNAYDFYNYLTNTWTAGGTHRTAGFWNRYERAKLSDGRIIFIGYNPAGSICIYNPVNDTWFDASSNPFSSNNWGAYNSVVVGKDGNLYIFNADTTISNSLTRYIVASDTWQVLTPLLAPTNSIQNAYTRTVSGGKFILVSHLLLTGGVTEGSWLFDVDSLTWTASTTYPSFGDYAYRQYQYGHGTIGGKPVEFGSPATQTPPYTHAVMFDGTF